MSAAPRGHEADVCIAATFVFVLCMVSAAVAQTPETAPTSAPPPSDQPVAPVPDGQVVPAPAPAVTTQPEQAAPVTDAALEARYHGAFEALARGERDAAVQLLQSIVAAAPDHSLADRARTLLSDLAATQPPPAPRSSWVGEESGVERPNAPIKRRNPREQHPTSAARAELVFFQTVHGLALGAELCAMSRCEEAQPWVLSMMLGAGAGFGMSWSLSRQGVTPGLSRALTDGVLWGAANGLGLALALDETGEASTTGAFLAAGQVLGLAFAGAMYSELKPTAGQVSLTASGGLWSLVITSQLVGAFEPDFQGETWAWLLLGTGNAGVLAGALFAHSVPMTTSRVLLIDAGGVLGTLSGLGLAILVQGHNSQPAATLIPGVLGTLGGLSLAYYLTRDWDAEDERDSAELHLGVMPVPNGAVANVSGYW